MKKAIWNFNNQAKIFNEDFGLNDDKLKDPTVVTMEPMTKAEIEKWIKLIIEIGPEDGA